jgi:hypothetical protein
MDHLGLFTLKHELLKISLYLQTSCVAEANLAEGQWPQEQLNLVKLRMFRREHECHLSVGKVVMFYAVKNIKNMAST